MTKTTFLIVEDEEIVAADLAGKLEQLGYEVVGTEAKGEEAVKSASRLMPEVVLMDIRLKGAMDGIEAAEAIQCRHNAPALGPHYSDIQYAAQILSLKVQYNVLFWDHRTIRAQYQRAGGDIYDRLFRR